MMTGSGRNEKDEGGVAQIRAEQERMMDDLLNRSQKAY